MIDYEEELKKFEPCLDVTDAESAIYERELTVNMPNAVSIGIEAFY